MRIIIITYPTPKDIESLVKIRTNDYIIAVDQAAFFAKKQGISFDLAVGDFDSLEDLSVLDGQNIDQLAPIKDVTDTEYALDCAILMQPSEILILGGMGGGARIEHFYAHTFLFKKYPGLVMINEYSVIKRLGVGIYHTTFNGFISLFAYPKAIISLEGFKYDLEAYVLDTHDPLCISNELVATSGMIEVHEGEILIFESKKE